MSCLYILEIKPLLVASFADIFSHSLGCLFTLFMVSSAGQKLVSLIRSHLVVYFVCLFLFLLPWETDLRKHWYNLCQRKFLPIISSRSFTVSYLMFKSISHFEFIFVHGVRVCSNFTDLHAAVQLSQHHLLKRLSFSHFIFLPPLSKIN